MGLTKHVAIVPDGVNVAASDLSKVAAALQKQVSRDFGPIWRVDATVDAYPRMEDVPTDYWPILIMKNVKDAAGFHDTKDNQPYAVVQFDRDWSLTASHECLEMLADPSGNRMQAGRLLDQAVALGQPQHRVDYLVEVSDPSESGEFGYQVNGIAVSDFLTPNFYDPVKASGVRYSFTGAIKAPRTVLPGGYISWHDPVTDKWMQLTYFNGGPELVDLSNNARFKALLAGTSVRAAIDAVTVHPAYASGIRGELASAFNTWGASAREAQAARAATLRAEVARLVANSAPVTGGGAGRRAARPVKRRPVKRPRR